MLKTDNKNCNFILITTQKRARTTLALIFYLTSPFCCTIFYLGFNVSYILFLEQSAIFIIKIFKLRYSSNKAISSQHSIVGRGLAPDEIHNNFVIMCISIG